MFIMIVKTVFLLHVAISTLFGGQYCKWSGTGAPVGVPNQEESEEHFRILLQNAKLLLRTGTETIAVHYLLFSICCLLVDYRSRSFY